MVEVVLEWVEGPSEVNAQRREHVALWGEWRAVVEVERRLDEFTFVLGYLTHPLLPGRVNLTRSHPSFPASVPVFESVEQAKQTAVESLTRLVSPG